MPKKQQAEESTSSAGIKADAKQESPDADSIVSIKQSIVDGLLSKISALEEQGHAMEERLSRAEAVGDVGRLNAYDAKHAKPLVRYVRLRTYVKGDRRLACIWDRMDRNESFINPVTGIRFVNQKITVRFEDDLAEGVEVTVNDYGHTHEPILMEYDDFQRMYEGVDAEIIEKRESDETIKIGETVKGEPQFITKRFSWFTVRRIDTGRVYRDLPETFVN